MPLLSAWMPAAPLQVPAAAECNESSLSDAKKEGRQHIVMPAALLNPLKQLLGGVSMLLRSLNSGANTTRPT
jgi:hypothetical protein